MANGLLTANNHDPLKEAPAPEPRQKQLLVGLPGRNNQSSLVWSGLVIVKQLLTQFNCKSYWRSKYMQAAQHKSAVFFCQKLAGPSYTIQYSESHCPRPTAQSNLDLFKPATAHLHLS